MKFALKDFEAGLQLQPSSPVLHYNRGLALARLQDKKGAKESFKDALADLAQYEEEDNMHKNKYKRKEDTSTKRDLFVSALEEFALRNLASVCMELEDNYDALSAFKRLLGAFPTCSRDVGVIEAMATTCHRMYDSQSLLCLSD